VVLPAVVTATLLLGAAALIGRAGDVWTWVHDVLPDVSRGTLEANNQSLPAWLARMFGSNPNFVDLSAGLGVLRWVGPAFALVGTGLLFARRRHAPLVVQELGIVLLLVLLAGPLTWDHYSTWAVLSLMLLADLRLWIGRPRFEVALLLAGVVVANGLMRTWARYPDPAAVDWWTRVRSGQQTVALLLLLVVGVRLVCTVPSRVEAEREGPRRLARDDLPPAGLHAHR
jgi:hypothetical protein